MKEKWKSIKGFEGLYKISNYGNVKSLFFWDINKRKYIIKERIIKPITDKDGYYIIGLYKNKKRKTYKVHRLVAEAFITNPNNLPQINHKDENKLNNRVDNLEWCSVIYNLKYGTRIQRAGNKHKKVVNQYDKDGNFIKSYNSLTEASKYVNGYITGISAVCNNKQKTAYGYVWKYTS